MSNMSNIENGFILINRSIKQTNIVNTLDLMWLFCHFCLNATYEDKEYILNWKRIILKKWSYVYSQLTLSEHFGLSIGKINKLIKLLEKIGICENKNTNKYSLVELKNDFVFAQSWKQNENKMKTKWNKIINNKNIKNIYIREIENYYYRMTWIDEKIINISSDISFEEFKKSFDNYLNIKNSPNTFYNYNYTLNNFVNSKNGYIKFLTAEIDDFLTAKGRIEEEIEKTQKKRKEIENKKNLEIRSEEIIAEKRNKYIDDFIYYMDKQEYNLIVEDVKNELIVQNKPFTENIIKIIVRKKIKDLSKCPY